MSGSTLATIPVRKVERFLTAIANLRDDDEAALSALIRQFGDMLTDVPSAKQWTEANEAATTKALESLKALRQRESGSEIGEQHDKPVSGHSICLFGPDEEIWERNRISNLSSYVRWIWRAKEKALHTLVLHELISAAGNPMFLLSAAIGETLWSLGPFAQSILYLLKHANRALVCGNPGCPAPLFFRSRRKRRQTYCSPKCSGFGQRKAKLKWWAEKGQERRKQLNQTNKRKQVQKAGRNGTRKTR